MAQYISWNDAAFFYCVFLVLYCSTLEKICKNEKLTLVNILGLDFYLSLRHNSNIKALGDIIFSERSSCTFH